MKNILTLTKNLAEKESFNSTNIEGVKIFRISQSQSRLPLSYAQGIVFVIQGAETIYFGGEKYIYDSQNYLVLPVPIIAECEVRASSEKPFLALTIDIDLSMLEGIVYQLNKTDALTHIDFQNSVRGLFVSPVSDDIKNTVFRLLSILSDSVASEVIGSQTVRELLFRVFINNRGKEFYNLTAKEAELSRIDNALKWMHQNFKQKVSISELANKVHMGESTFHRVFKDITKQSPTQYLKKLRLSHARNLIIENGYQVQQAAFNSGYNSTTQFAREFKRLYGKSPSEFYKA
ncbi:AraC family transcriptional regulator [Agarilytica rhodophyticola]|uniref:AraC family transcriptional regulator n=1 Tax=Agarilytica rhodophyticola TaxID=1737490 RepID=UPI000CD9E1B3|nr:AraC family transcriptional regulator [Agarilytica rhodophyticola]